MSLYEEQNAKPSGVQACSTLIKKQQIETKIEYHLMLVHFQEWSLSQVPLLYLCMYVTPVYFHDGFGWERHPKVKR